MLSHSRRRGSKLPSETSAGHYCTDMRGDKRPFERRVSFSCDSDQPAVVNEHEHELDETQRVEKVCSSADQPDWSSEGKVRQFGEDKHINQMAPSTPVLRTAARPPKARRTAVVPLPQQMECPAAAAADRPDGLGKFEPKRKLQKLGRLRARDFDITLLDP